MAGAGLGLLREATERGLLSAGQVRRELGVPCLCLLPERSPEAAALPTGDAAEALRAVKLALDQTTGVSRARRIGFAPVSAGDGATATARGFAALVAAGGTPTLIIDADMRGNGPGLDHALAPGFSDTLGGHGVTPTPDPATGLSILPAGTNRQAAAAAVALAAPEVGDALARAAAPFPCVIVDLPPLDRFVDARATVRHLDALVIVARWRRTERRHIRAILATDRDLRQKVAGVILKRAAPGAVDRYDDDLTLDGLA
jgi:succinoglycan biosynthesis transport protein ExoP